MTGLIGVAGAGSWRIVVLVRADGASPLREWVGASLSRDTGEVLSCNFHGGADVISTACATCMLVAFRKFPSHLPALTFT